MGGHPFHLTIIAKAPVPGRVKTRLCPPCTHEQAADVAAAALDDTFDAVERVAAEHAARPVLLLDGEPGAFVRAGFDVVPQCGHGLASRLANGFHDLGPGVIIGMETPAGGRWLADALAAVRRGRDAIGLASDGGYWVIGLADADLAVFEGVAMSRGHTGITQMRRLYDLGREVRLLPMLRDLDTIDDLRSARGDQGRLGAIARKLLGAD
jgi:glycosyltransferase A (GT-A) superfamily protein (DUF2064 family)